jgi:hypothetical protein
MRRYLRRVAELQLETGSDCFREIEMHFTLAKWREERRHWPRFEFHKRQFRKSAL